MDSSYRRAPTSLFSWVCFALAERRVVSADAIPADLAAQWFRPMATDDADLAGEAKVSDREQAREYIPALKRLLAPDDGAPAHYMHSASAGERSRHRAAYFFGDDTPDGPAGGLPVDGAAVPDPLPVTDRGRAPSLERCGRAPLPTGSGPCFSFGAMFIRSLVGVVQPFN